MSYPSPEEVQWQEYLLHRRKYVAQVMVDRGMAAAADQLELEAQMDHMLQRMVLRLTTEVLAEHVLDDEVTLPWSGTVTRTRPGQSMLRGWWLPYLLAVLGGIAALFVGFGDVGAAVYLASGVMALVGVVLVAANPPRSAQAEELPVTGQVTVPVTYWRTFPQATLRYPDTLGPYVRMMELGNPYWTDGGV